MTSISRRRIDRQSAAILTRLFSEKAHVMQQEHTSGGREGASGLFYRLENEFYVRILAHCDKIDSLVADLHDGDVHQAASLYTSLCRKLTSQVVQYVRKCRYGLLPYAHHLLEGEQGETVAPPGPAQPVHEMKEAHAHIRSTLVRLRAVEMSPMPDGAHAQTLMALRQEIVLLDGVLNEFFSVEDSLLIPLLQA